MFLPNNNQSNENRKSRTSRQLITINRTHQKGKAKYIYPFRTTASFDANTRLSVNKVSIYNSTYNIKASYNNNTYSIRWIDGTLYNFILPDGFYSADTLSERINYDMTQNKLYLVRSDDPSKYLLPIEIKPNSITYKHDINIGFIPSQSYLNQNNLTHILPAGATWSLPTINTTPQLILSAGLQIFTGFPNQNTFPLTQLTFNNTNARIQTFSSTTAPKLQQVSNYLLSCNLIENELASVVPTIIHQIPLTSTFGSLIKEENISEARLSVKKGFYRDIQIELFDDDFNLLDLNDPDIVISLIIEQEVFY
jgi:hypothetical protein